MSVIFPETTLPFYENGGLYGFETTSPTRMFEIEVGERYEVVFDGEKYIAEGQTLELGGDTMLCLGNTSTFGGEDTGEPFIFVERYIDSSYAYFIYTNIEGSAHTIGINTVEEGSTEPPIQEGIVLKDYAGNEVIYSGVKNIKIPTSSGGTQMFVAGELVEKVIDLAMADGDQVIEAEENTLLTKVTVLKPETLIPENIAKDVEIGGVVGTHEGGGGSSGAYTVKVIDYDGTIIKEEKHNSGDVFTLPEPPNHSRLVFDGWSSTVDIIDDTITVEDCDVLIGPMYYTASGVTEVDVEANALTGLTIGFSSSVLTGCSSIDWGDGITDTSLKHTYADYGEYTIKIYGLTRLANGNSSLMFAYSSNCEMVKGVYFANGITSIGNYAFYNHKSLLMVTMPKSLNTIGTYAFQNCYMLGNIVIPSSVTIISDYSFGYGYLLSDIVIPSGVTKIGNSAFYSNYGLQKIIIPSSVKTIGNRCFSACYSLKEIDFPEGITIIDQYAVGNSYALTRIGIPSTITTISAYAFMNIKAKEFDFSKCKSVPVLSATTAFNGILKTSKIKVPASLYDAWIAASNWSTYASYIVAV